MEINLMNINADQQNVVFVLNDEVIFDTALATLQLSIIG